MRSQIIIFIVFLGFIALRCNDIQKNQIYGQWLVLEFSYEDELVIPDTSGLVVYYPGMSFFRNGGFSIPTTWTNKEAQMGRFKIKVNSNEYRIIMYKSVDTRFNGTFSVNIFSEPDRRFPGNINTFMEVYNSEFYLLLKKNLDL